MARTKNIVHKRRHSTPKFNHGLESSEIIVKNIKEGRELKRERRIGRTSVNWTGNETFPGYNKKEASLITSFDFRQNDTSYFKARENRAKSAPIKLTGGDDDDDDDVFTDVENGGASRNLDIDLKALETVANANEHTDDLMNKSRWNKGQLDSHYRLHCPTERGVANGGNGKYYLDKVSSNNRTPQRGDNGITKNSLHEPKSILSNDRAKSARTALGSKKVCIVERPKSCYSDRFTASALRKFNKNFQRRPIRAQDYLPRKSFFSCHDNLLVDAGINPRDLTDLGSTKRKPRFCDDDSSSDNEDEPNNDTEQENVQKAKSETNVTELKPVPNTKDEAKDEAKDESLPEVSKDGTETKVRYISTLSVEDTVSEYSESDQDLSLSNSMSSFRVAARVTGIIARMKQIRNKSTSSNPGLRRRHVSQCEDYDTKTIKVDPKPIVEYLTLVKEKPEEYLAMKNVKKEKTGVGAIDNLVSTGTAYRKGRSQSLVVQAAYELGSKSQPKIVQRYEAEKAKLLTKKVSSVSRPQSRPQSSASVRHSTTQNPKLNTG